MSISLVSKQISCSYFLLYQTPHSRCLLRKGVLITLTVLAQLLQSSIREHIICDIRRHLVCQLYLHATTQHSVKRVQRKDAHHPPSFCFLETTIDAASRASLQTSTVLKFLAHGDIAYYVVHFVSNSGEHDLFLFRLRVCGLLDTLLFRSSSCLLFSHNGAKKL